MAASAAGGAAAGSAAAAADWRTGALSHDVPARHWQAVLAGVGKRAIGEGDGVVDQLAALLDDAASNGSKTAADPAKRAALLEGTEGLLAHAAAKGLSPADLRVALDEVPITAEHRLAVVEYWKTQHGKAHAHMVARSSWTPTVQGTSYRIDVLTSSRTSRDLSEPTAILELKTGLRPGATGGSGAVGGDGGVLRFEMNREQLARVLKSVTEAEAVIAAHSAT